MHQHTSYVNFQDIPFDNPYSGDSSKTQIPSPVQQPQTESPLQEGDVTGYSPPVTEDFHLPGLISSTST